eukprot:CAMPEP_0180832572 /NCGR_PEP_ID=MMETSP1038_2-20121128/76908_1 /TAXON_ID=632150 /ORGANISM="Azadinium spinosum, Strain 3D9" /LENGTH=77 /DNA_ID=CAMNT_0022875775 /DNA_START=375 /DNA_END=608 /DNA_ORIENTATION=+
MVGLMESTYPNATFAAQREAHVEQGCHAILVRTRLKILTTPKDLRLDHAEMSAVSHGRSQTVDQPHDVLVTPCLQAL